jgi:hypothetical protein
MGSEKKTSSDKTTIIYNRKLEQTFSSSSGPDIKITQTNNSKMKMTKENIYPILPKQKSLVIAYLLWLFGGIFGFHHLYLHRDRHAFVWWCTLGELHDFFFELMKLLIYNNCVRCSV